MEKEQCWACLIRVKRANFKIFPKPDFLHQVGTAKVNKGIFQKHMGTIEKSSKPEAYVSKAVSYSICTVVHAESFNDATKTRQCCILPSVNIFWCGVAIPTVKKTETDVSNVKKWMPLFRKGNVLLFYKRFQTNAVILFTGSVAHGPGKRRWNRQVLHVMEM